MAETLNLGDGKSVKINWKNRSLYDIRNSAPVVKELERRGRQIARQANATLDENRLGRRIRERRGAVGYRMSSFRGQRRPFGRWFVQVYTSSNHAKYSEAKNNTLIRVLNETQNISTTALEEYTP